MENLPNDWDAYFAFSTKKYLNWWQTSDQDSNEQLQGLINSQSQVIQLIQTYQQLAELDKSAAFALDGGQSQIYKDVIIDFHNRLYQEFLTLLKAQPYRPINLFYKEALPLLLKRFFKRSANENATGTKHLYVRHAAAQKRANKTYKSLQATRYMIDWLAFCDARVQYVQPTNPVSNSPINEIENDEILTTNRTANKLLRLPCAATIERNKELKKFFNQVAKKGRERAVSLTAKKFKVSERTVERALNSA